MTEAAAIAAIEAKRSSLESDKRGLGEPLADVEAAGSGGFVRRFSGGHIYWHATPGAHEVHGNVLKHYLLFGGPGPNPATGRREFGFPTADEANGPVGEPMSTFELGRIHAVPGFRPAAAYGRLAQALRVALHGMPVSEPIQLSAGEAMFTRRGCLFTTDALAPEALFALIAAPQLGRPGFMLGEPGEEAPVSIEWRIRPETWARFLSSHGGTAKRVTSMMLAPWTDRLVLKSVGDPNVQRRLVVSPGQPVVKPDGEVRLSFGCRLANDDKPLPDRTLFDLSVRLPGEELYPFASHALYARRDWERFGFAHATDLHVTGRAEGFRPKLRAAGMTRGARRLANPNDSLRAFIRWANAAHDRGELDFILATGDLVDYVFDDSDRHVDSNNFALLHRILLGDARPRDPEGTEAEELRAPIYTVLGNHDYVLNPAPLLFDVDVQAPLSNREIRRWEDYNLTRQETKLLQDGKEPFLSSEAAVDLLDSGEDALPYYLSEINRERNYIIDVGGRHRIAMLDAGPNKDVIGGTWDAIQQYFGFSNEDEESFVRGVPNTAGRDDDTLSRAAALQRSGVFVVGIHAPPLNPARNEYAHFFRETERTMVADRLTDLTRRFITRQRIFFGVPDDWLTGRAPHFHRGTIGSLLDYGIVKLRSASPDEFLKQLVNDAVDVLLCGHVHERVEFRVRVDGDELLLFTDFYTENPPAFREGWDWALAQRTPSGSVTQGDTRPIFLQVGAYAIVGDTPREMTDRGTDHLPANAPDGTITVSRNLAIKPYDDPLSDTTDPAAWWEKHRPLILQTACLGPVDHVQRVRIDETVDPPQAHRVRQSFQGVRLFTVDGDHITRASYVDMERIRTVDGGPIPLPLAGWFISEGTGKWRQINTASERLEELAFGDFTGDGKTDVFHTDGKTWSISEGGTGKWRQINTASERLEELAFGDFTGDGKTDVFHTDGKTWSISEGGTGKWRQINTASERLEELAFGDFTGDGKTDVFHTDGKTWSISEGGTGKWRQINTASERLEELAFGDFTGDGKTDVFHTDGKTWSISEGGTGKWRQINTASERLEELAFGDFTGDGKTDVFHTDGKTWSISEGGTGKWRQINTASERLEELAFGDFTGDGKTDVFHVG